MVKNLGRSLRQAYWSNQSLSFRNREREIEYDFTLPSPSLRPGMSAMLRVKNEETLIEGCLDSIRDVFSEIVLIDNGSTDRTAEIISRYQAENDPSGKIRLYHYPFSIARCGSEHASTPEDSVHSLVYYYNWCLSKCTRSYVCKWDADMYLHPDFRAAFREVVSRTSYGPPVKASFGVQTLYRASTGDYFLGRREIHEEPRIFPNSAGVRFFKGDAWEVLRSLMPVTPVRMPLVGVYEMKDVREDEFSHWSGLDFEAAPRKKLEHENYRLLQEGRIDEDRFEPVGALPMSSPFPKELMFWDSVVRPTDPDARARMEDSLQSASVSRPSLKSRIKRKVTRRLDRIFEDALPYIEPREVRHRLVRSRVWLLRELEVAPETEYTLDEFFRLRSIFFHIPKTAGLSVSDALFGGRGAGHFDVEAARLIFGERALRSFYKFCFVRNPWSRLVSTYSYLRKGGVNRTFTPWIREHILGPADFSEFVKSRLRRPEVLADQHLRPQAKFVCDRAGTLVVDYVGRFENIEADFDVIASRLGIARRLPQKNASEHRDYRSYFDDEMIEIVGDVYQRDVELFGYTFDGDASRPGGAGTEAQPANGASLQEQPANGVSRSAAIPNRSEAPAH
jgi:hypothetical protein